ncbi:MAG: hypothetical protein LAP40_23090 [Acidobacteriia bacterium]|nr:hypothetical protein [Terriglobia bacterium]
MDLKHYYQKIRNIEAGIAEAFVVVMSLETPDGGKPGTLTEVIPRVAAKMIVDGIARLASAEEAKQMRDRQAEALRAVEQAAAASRVQLTVLPTSELNRLRASVRPPKE